MVVGKNESEAEFWRVLGDELRQAREERHWIREELADKLGLHYQTVAGYENGNVKCSAFRFIEICRTLGVPALDLMSRAMQRTKVDLRTTGVEVDLHAVTRDRTGELALVRRWARKKLKANPDGTGVAHLEWATIQEIAIMSDLDGTSLAHRLAEFFPRHVGF